MGYSSIPDKEYKDLLQLKKEHEAFLDVISDIACGYGCTGEDARENVKMCEQVLERFKY